ncbi:hypothetical protein [Prochlorococcus marinus]|uniref:hypothetical protein n=1 Tax=Prochlorococcus marinus TaxID=1219 RepID=UPI0022B3145E|nr:hypothetical protein [Prochlorococcus marinus]
MSYISLLRLWILSPKETHRYAFAMVMAARTMPVDIAEKLDHIKQLRFNVQLKELRKRINRRIT